MIDKRILHGKTITLRPLNGKDAEIIFASLHDEEINRLTGTQESFTLEQVHTHYSSLEQASDRVDYAIVAKDSPQDLLGEVVLNAIDWKNRSATFRIALFNTAYFNQGYGSEATRLMVMHGFDVLELYRIELEFYTFNTRAQHVYQKIGFKQEGIRRGVLLWKGTRYDAVIMAMLKPDYDAHMHEN